MSSKLFAVYLGGRVAKCNIELHDVVFAVGTTLETTYVQLLTKWFGDVRRLHIDSWVELNIVDGHRVSLHSSPPAETDTKKMYFINVGGYAPGLFAELHATSFLVADSEGEAKARAKCEVLKGTQRLHIDDCAEIDDCLKIEIMNDFYIHLDPTAERHTLEPVNGYHPIPKDIVTAFVARKRRGQSEFEF